MREDGIRCAAGFSPCRTWRYWLSRSWAQDRGTMVVIGLNPSTADERKDDPTIRRCIGFARTWGFGELLMMNLFGYRATRPPDMLAAPDPVGPETDAYLQTLTLPATENARPRPILCAWGTSGRKPGAERARHVLELLKGRELLCLGRTTDGSPEHPLYIPADRKPMRYP